MLVHEAVSVERENAADSASSATTTGENLDLVVTSEETSSGSVNLSNNEDLQSGNSDPLIDAPAHFKWNYAEDAINVVKINGEELAFEKRTFDSTFGAAPTVSIYYEYIPLNPDWMMPLYNWLVMGAVKKPKPTRVIFSRCALFHPDHGHRFYVMVVLSTMCISPYTAYYICDSTRLCSAQADAFFIWKDADIAGFESDPNYCFDLDGQDGAWTKFMQYAESNRIIYDPSRGLKRRCNNLHALKAEEIAALDQSNVYLLREGEEDTLHIQLEKRAPAGGKGVHRKVDKEG